MEVEIDYLAIGKIIRTARLSKKMTQETLSNMIDVAPTYVSSIENGHTKLSLATLLGIAQSLDTTVVHLCMDQQIHMKIQITHLQLQQALSLQQMLLI